MNQLPAPDNVEAIHAFAASFDGHGTDETNENLESRASERLRETVPDLRAELYFAERRMRIDAVSGHEEPTDAVATLYRELLPIFLHLAGNRSAFVEAHHRVLSDAFFEGRAEGRYLKPWGKKSPRRWAEIAEFDFALELPDAVLNRDDLYSILVRTGDPRIAAALVLAWGEMKKREAKTLFAESEWLELIPPLRDGRYTRAEAYDRFLQLRNADRLPGMGPAFFTKLIFFLRPGERDANGRGYIMDQWTAASVNLLYEQDLVVLQKLYPKGLRVDDRNTANYERFNQVIEFLALQWRYSGEDVELALFGKGGRSPDSWRQHVRLHARHRWAGAKT